MSTRLTRIARSHRSTLTSTLSLGLAVSALACTNQGVDLGGGTLVQGLVHGSRCADSNVVDDDVLVTSQGELDALEGCEEIHGQLTVQVFANADLTPLHTLRIVEGALYLGASAQDTLTNDQYSDAELLQSIQEREAALFSDGWQASLSGVESLERIGALILVGISSVDLSAFQHLASLGGAPTVKTTPRPFLSGELVLTNNPNLRDFTGFERVRGLADLQLDGNASLESLSGLTPETNLSVFAARNSLALTNIDALSAVQFINALSLDAVGLSDLHALSGLTGVGDTLFVQNSPALVDASGLAGVQQAGSILFDTNAVLETLPHFSSFFSLPKGLIVRNNPALVNVTLDFSRAVPQTFPVGDNYRELGIDSIEIGNDARLTSFNVTPSVADSFGLTVAQVASIHDNPSLTQVDLGSLKRIGLLSIADNPQLAEVKLGAVEGVESLDVTGNPLLSTAVFADTPTFERHTSGNAD